MAHSEILEKAMLKAIDGGWKQDLVWIHGNVKDKKKEFLESININETYIGVGYDDVSFNDVIFNHDFAKALWGEGAMDFDRSQYRGASIGVMPYEPWKDHLQQMVIAEDPIKYLGDNL